MTLMVKRNNKNPCRGGYEIYNFVRPVHGHHYYALSLSEPFLRVK